MDELLERVRRDLHAHAAESQAEAVRMYEEFAERRRAMGDFKRAAYWGKLPTRSAPSRYRTPPRAKAEKSLRDP